VADELEEEYPLNSEIICYYDSEEPNSDVVFEKYGTIGWLISAWICFSLAICCYIFGVGISCLEIGSEIYHFKV